MYATEEEEEEEEMTPGGFTAKDQKLGKEHWGCGCLVMLGLTGYIVHWLIMWLSTQTS